LAPVKVDGGFALPRDYWGPHHRQLHHREKRNLRWSLSSNQLCWSYAWSMG
jgi:hypothetical protein